MGKKHRRVFDKEFKTEAVRLATTGERTAAEVAASLGSRGKTPRSRCFARIDADFGREDEGIGVFVSRIPSGAPSKGQGRYTTPALQRELSF